MLTKTKERTTLRQVLRCPKDEYQIDALQNHIDGLESVLCPRCQENWLEIEVA